MSDPNESGKFETLLFRRLTPPPPSSTTTPGDRRQQHFGPPNGMEERRGVAPAPPPQPEYQWLPGFEKRATRVKAILGALAGIITSGGIIFAAGVAGIFWVIGKADEPHINEMHAEIAEQAATTTLLLENSEYDACLNESRANDPDGRVRAIDCPPDVVQARVQAKLNARAVGGPP